MREPTRINPTHLAENKSKRDAIKTLPGNSGNSIPEIRDRLKTVEEIIGLRTHGT